jgi:hypothetical protein
MTFQRHLIAATLTVAVALITPVWADSLTFSAGSADGRLGSLSQPASASKLETETADDFILTETTSIRRATTFNMTFSLAGDTITEAGTPGQANCHGKSVSALAKQFRGIHAAASALGFSSVAALQDGLKAFCEQ